MSNLLLAAVMLIVIAAPLPAQTTRESETSGDRPRRLPEWLRDRFPSPRMDEGDWEKVEEFMKANSPKRWQMYQNAPPSQQARLKPPIWTAWRSLERLQSEAKEIYDVRLKRLPVEDQIFGLMSDIRRSGGRASAEQRKQLRTKVGQFVDLRQEERRLRIKKLEETLAREKEQLAETETDREGTIERSTREVETSGPAALLGQGRRNNEERSSDSVSKDASQLAPQEKR
jgi:hypothetical protein